MNILFLLYNIFICKENFDEIKEQIKNYSKTEIFYILNLSMLLIYFFQEQIIEISNYFNNKGISYLIDDFNRNKKILFVLFKLSIKLIYAFFVLFFFGKKIFFYS